MRCDGPNWGENADWCVIHERDPLMCVSLDREALETENRELRNAARIGTKNIRVWLREGCGCEPEGHVCGIQDVRKDLEFIERVIQKAPVPVSPEKISVREACRRRFPPGGADAEALEHGMTQLEEEKKALQNQVDALSFRIQMIGLNHPVGCAEAGAMLKKQMDLTQARMTQKEAQVEAMREWACTGCGLHVKNDPRWNVAFPENIRAHCKRCGKEIHPSFAFCTVCLGILNKL